MEGTVYAPTAAGATGAPNEHPAPSVRDAVHRTLAGNGGEMALDRLARTVATRTNRAPTADWVHELQRTHLPGLVEEGLLFVRTGEEPTVGLRPVEQRPRYAGP